MVFFGAPKGSFLTWLECLFHHDHPWKFHRKTSVEFWCPSYRKLNGILGTDRMMYKYSPEFPNDWLENQPWMSRCISYWKWGIFHCHVSLRGCKSYYRVADHHLLNYLNNPRVEGSRKKNQRTSPEQLRNFLGPLNGKEKVFQTVFLRCRWAELLLFMKCR